MLKSAGIFTLFFGLALSASTYGELWRELRVSEPDEGKCTKIPPTFTAGFTQTVSASFAGKNVDFINYGLLYCDSPKEMKVMAKMNTIDPKSGKHMKMLMYQFGKDTYLAMPQLNKCFKNHIPGPSTFAEMMEGATFTGLRRYGGSGDSMAVESWFVHRQDANMTVDMGVNLSQESCTINTAVCNMKFNGGYIMYHLEYYDTKRSVEDPNVFTLPEYCNNAHGFF